MKIALIGYGIENAGAYRYLAATYPDAEFVTYDNKTDEPADLPEGVGFVGGSDFSDVTADLFVRSPGISPHRLPAGVTITTATKIFFDECPVPIIGVTGSKGKGTTCSLIANILQADGKTVWLVGNIGTPALDVLGRIREGDIVVYEMSSFQLWDIGKSPHTAVVLMIEPEHLDVHEDLEDYVNAKANIARYQTKVDRLVYKAGNQYSERIAAMSPAAKVPYGSADYAHEDNLDLVYGDETVADITAIRLPGRHNIDNALAAIDAAWPYVTDKASIARGIAAFDGLPHRLKKVRQVGGVDYYDDSIATTPGSAIAAMRSFDQRQVVILGGSSKGADFTELAAEAALPHSRWLVLIGDEADRIEDALLKLSDGTFDRYTKLAGRPAMADIVREAQEHAEPGDIVILSPACASFGMFKNYADRGDQFIEAVDSIAAVNGSDD